MRNPSTCVFRCSATRLSSARSRAANALQAAVLFDMTKSFFWPQIWFLWSKSCFCYQNLVLVIKILFLSSKSCFWHQNLILSSKSCFWPQVWFLLSKSCFWYQNIVFVSTNGATNDIPVQNPVPPFGICLGVPHGIASVGCWTGIGFWTGMSFVAPWFIFSIVEWFTRY